MGISTIMILAAGLGKRMKLYTKNVPKPLIKIGGETLIEKMIKKLTMACSKSKTGVWESRVEIEKPRNRVRRVNGFIREQQILYSYLTPHLHYNAIRGLKQ